MFNYLPCMARQYLLTNYYLTTINWETHFLLFTMARKHRCVSTNKRRTILMKIYVYMPLLVFIILDVRDVRITIIGLLVNVFITLPRFSTPNFTSHRYYLIIIHIILLNFSVTLCYNNLFLYGCNCRVWEISRFFLISSVCALCYSCVDTALATLHTMYFIKVAGRRVHADLMVRY